MMGTGTESATWYYVGSFGQLGPLTFGQLEELVDGGVVERETYVWNPSLPSWLPAQQVPQLALALGRRLPYLEPPPTPSAVHRPVGGSGGSPFSGLRNELSPPAPAPPTIGGHVPRPPSLGANVPSNQATSLSSAFASYASPYGMRSDRSRTVAGVLNIIVPGIGRLYLGYSALGVIQLFAAFLSCGILHIWSIIDGVMMLTGQVKIDGYGRILND